MRWVESHPGPHAVAAFQLEADLHLRALNAGRARRDQADALIVVAEGDKVHVLSFDKEGTSSFRSDGFWPIGSGVFRSQRLYFEMRSTGDTFGQEELRTVLLAVCATVSDCGPPIQVVMVSPVGVQYCLPPGLSIPW